MKNSIKNFTLTVIVLTNLVCCDVSNSKWTFKALNEEPALFYEEQLVTQFHKATPNKPSLHPLSASDGQDILRAHPFYKREGEHLDHPHHTGLWYAHGDVNGVDFWHFDKPNSGKTVQTSFKTTIKSDAATAVSTNEWQDKEGHILLNDTRYFTFTRQNADLILDFKIEMVAAQPEVIFGDTKEGDFALRLHHMFDAKEKGETGRMINSVGGSGKDIWGKKANWVAYSGTNEKGQAYSVVIFDHPSNLRYPTTWMARDYGLFAVNPFGLSFYTNKKENGEHRLKQGEGLTFQYRVILQIEEANPDAINTLYSNYSKLGSNH